MLTFTPCGCHEYHQDPIVLKRLRSKPPHPEGTSGRASPRKQGATPTGTRTHDKTPPPRSPPTLPNPPRPLTRKGRGDGRKLPALTDRP
eukprot:7449940-Karenia_brevis.AAC.1